jgi:uncharacterized protein YndB with AHSA1/START domain
MSKIETSTITLAVGFHAPAELIWACFTDQNQMSGYTQTPCKLEPKEGGAISMMNGAITGQYKKLVSGKTPPNHRCL